MGHRHGQVAPVAGAAQLAADGVGHRDARLAGVDDVVDVRRALEVGDPRRRDAGADRQPGVRVGAHRLRVGRAEDQVAAGALAVGPAAREQLAADAAALQRLGHSEEREAPDPLADEREPDALDAAVAARPPSSRRDRCSADGGCARAGAPRARPPARRRSSCRGPRRRRGRRRPRPRRAWGGCRRRWHASAVQARAADALPFAVAHGRPQAEAVALAHAKRRAQHKISAPTYNACPTCHSPRLPHRVCPACGSYAGREVVHVHDHDHDHEH